MGDRTETVRYKIVVDQEGLPETIQPKQIPGPPPLPGGEATPPPLPGEEESPRQRVRVQRVPHEARMFEMFARLLRTPQFSSGMADSLFGFAQRAGLAASSQGSALRPAALLRPPQLAALASKESSG